MFRRKLTYLLVKGLWKNFGNDGKNSAFLNWLSSEYCILIILPLRESS